MQKTCCFYSSPLIERPEHLKLPTKYGLLLKKVQKNKRRFCVPRKQKKIEDGFQASSFLSSAAVHFYDPINRALNDWQVFFGTEFQLVTGSLALLTFREQHFGIEIPFYRKPAGLDKLDCDREAGDSLFILNVGEIPLFNIYYFRQRLMRQMFAVRLMRPTLSHSFSLIFKSFNF